MKLFHIFINRCKKNCIVKGSPELNFGLALHLQVRCWECKPAKSYVYPWIIEEIVGNDTAKVAAISTTEDLVLSPDYIKQNFKRDTSYYIGIDFKSMLHGVLNISQHRIYYWFSLLQKPSKIAMFILLISLKQVLYQSKIEDNVLWAQLREPVWARNSQLTVRISTRVDL